MVFKILGEKKRSRPGVGGLVNQKQNCFLNVVLQLFFGIKNFKEQIVASNGIFSKLVSEVSIFIK